ncbi:MAG TPA: TetR/AcrR family transcriptional regulator [Pusillimonas sp.]|jgi:AcrR family transcriptional regulator|nr:TetR family transcriptional regulator [Pusillimonas sp.]MBC41601.1 TetR family transcriptional regulator [Pusillimonas sp.]HBT31786.1 TetR/AcrR family transcriptional regulator [Pusillimonas sp.]HCN72955.1 TetR/AcrR family transcriptional regulator [Pusillimonas sp.]HCP77141.1 TetR/AcrR family transcriptional regulator [Pusillimonas sp.]|tara:strand:- start:38 stop:799 length:762 start_codon:yes stop_codon:yes gene_type:complete
MLKSSWVDKEGRKASLRSDGLAVYDDDNGADTGREKRPGRPTVDRDIRNQIIDIAEMYFADRGYALTSTREIAAQAGVRQSMISYYFKSKRSLFEAVIKNRGQAISVQRMRNLDTLLKKYDGNPPVGNVIRAYLLPLFSLLHSGPRGIAFVRLLARLHNEPEELSFRLRREVYDDSVKHYLDVLERLLPAVSPADIHWRMMFLIGICLYTLSGLGRLEELSEGRYTDGSIDEMVARLNTFLVHGMQAPSTPGW